MKSEAGKKSFDVMKWLRETRDRHYEETKDMTPEERLRWLKKRPTDPVLAEFFDRIKVVQPVRAAPEVGPALPGPSWMTGATPVRSDDPGVPGGFALKPRVRELLLIAVKWESLDGSCASIESDEARVGKARREGIGNATGPRISAEQGLGEDKCILYMT